jgi:hypothetical protein
MTEKSPNFLEKHKKGIAATVALGAVATFGIKEGGPKLNEWLNPKSEIVRGVPAQVEAHSYNQVCSTRIKGICTTWTYNYFLGLEQNQKDIDAAKEGHVTQSFDPKVGEVYADSNYDKVKVNKATWNAYPDGSVISFDGALSDPLHK